MQVVCLHSARGREPLIGQRPRGSPPGKSNAGTPCRGPMAQAGVGAPQRTLTPSFRHAGSLGTNQMAPPRLRDRRWCPLDRYMSGREQGCGLDVRMHGASGRWEGEAPPQLNKREAVAADAYLPARAELRSCRGPGAQVASRSRRDPLLPEASRGPWCRADATHGAAGRID